MSARDRMLLKVVVPLVAVLAFWFLALSPRLGDLHKAGDDLAAARSDLTAAQGKLAAQRDDSAQLRAQRSAGAAAQRAIPSTTATPALLRQLQSIAHRSGIDLQSVTPGAAAAGSAAPSPDVDAVPLSLTFTGSYTASQSFLRNLGALVRVTGSRVHSTGRLMSISSVSLAQGEGSALSGTVTASLYTLRSAAEVTAATAPSSTGTSTAATSTTAASPAS